MTQSTAQQSQDRPTGIQGFTTLDLVMIAVLGVVFGLLNTPFGVVFQFLQTTFGPAGQALFAPWAISMVLTALIVRKPGAALLNGLINGLFQLLSGNPAGVVNLAWGFALGAGVEVGIALYMYLAGARRLSWQAAMLGGGIACAFSYTVSAIVYQYLSAGTMLLIASWIAQGVAGAFESGLVAFALAEGLRRSGLLRSYGMDPRAAPA
jgi:energy-coupling factor transport system substrate-specific component